MNEIYYLILLEARCLKSRYPQAQAASEGSRRGSLLVSSSFWGFLVSLGLCVQAPSMFLHDLSGCLFL